MTRCCRAERHLGRALKTYTRVSGIAMAIKNQVDWKRTSAGNFTADIRKAATMWSFEEARLHGAYSIPKNFKLWGSPTGGWQLYDADSYHRAQGSKGPRGGNFAALEKGTQVRRSHYEFGPRVAPAPMMERLSLGPHQLKDHRSQGPSRY
jgi:hypothetical protein